MKNKLEKLLSICSEEQIERAKKRLARRKNKKFSIFDIMDALVKPARTNKKKMKNYKAQKKSVAKAVRRLFANGK